MERTTIKLVSRPKLKNPVLIQGLPGIGNVGRIAAGYLVNELKTKLFAELYSPHFLPIVVVRPDGIMRPIKAEFYYYKSKHNDFVFLIGDSQSITSHGYYEIAGKIVDFAKEIGVKEIITLGGLGVEKVVKEPKVVGAANSEAMRQRLEQHGIEVRGELITNIVGIAGLVPALAKNEEIDAACLLAETPGFPLVIADPIAAESMLRTLLKLFDLKVDLGKLEKEAKELEEKLKKTREMQQKMLEQLKTEERREIGYIG